MVEKYISPNTIEEMAQSTRDDFPAALAHDGICEVSILTIADGLGCFVEEVDFNPESVIAKVLRNKDPESPYAYTIQVARKDGPRRQRFSIAHEVSHIILHDDGKSEFIERRQALVDYNVTELYKETQANMLAAALLMPKEQVQQFWEHTKSIDEVADIFNVSVDAAANRLSNLGLLSNE